MICATIRKGSECSFMAAKGCSYKKGFCLPVVEKCTGCGKIVHVEAGTYCSVAPEPALKWKVGNCNMATHIVEVAAVKEKINPLKASKRSMGK